MPVVVVSAFSPAHGARAVDALAEGAFDLVPKPALGEALERLHRRARQQGHEAAHSGRVRRPAARARTRAVRRHTPAAPRPAAAASASW